MRLDRVPEVEGGEEPVSPYLVWTCRCGAHHLTSAAVCLACRDTLEAALEREHAERQAGRGELADWQRDKLEYLHVRWKRGELD